MSGTTKRLKIDNSNDDYGNGVNYNANMHQLVKLSTIHKNWTIQTIESQEQHRYNTQAKLLKNVYHSKANHR